jgi:DNA-binding XRE family transcriptional regulator
VEIGGKPYVILPRDDFDRLVAGAQPPGVNAAPFGMISVGPDLRARRHQAGMTLSELADRADIAPETLSRIENGHTNPSIRTVRSILNALEETDPP